MRYALHWICFKPSSSTTFLYDRRAAAASAVSAARRKTGQNIAPCRCIYYYTYSLKYGNNEPLCHCEYPAPFRIIYRILRNNAITNCTERKNRKWRERARERERERVVFSSLPMFFSRFSQSSVLSLNLYVARFRIMTGARTGCFTNHVRLQIFRLPPDILQLCLFFYFSYYTQMLLFFLNFCIILSRFRSVLWRYKIFFFKWETVF